MTQGGLIHSADNSVNLPKQHVNRRQIARSKTFIQHFFKSSKDADYGEDLDPKTKNIRQTELVCSLAPWFLII